MKQDFIDYLLSLNLAEGIIKRVEEILIFYNENIDKNIEDIFVTDYKGPTSERVFENLWLFSEKHVMEAKFFIKEDNFDRVFMKNNILYWEIIKKDYDFKKALSSSELSINIILVGGDVSVDLRASGSNCDKLRDIFPKYIKNNLIEVEKSN